MCYSLVFNVSHEIFVVFYRFLIRFFCFVGFNGGNEGSSTYASSRGAVGTSMYGLIYLIFLYSVCYSRGAMGTNMYGLIYLIFLYSVCFLKFRGNVGKERWRSC
jgi:hypothetical protein